MWDFSKITDLLKLLPTYLLPMAVLSGFLVFASDDVLADFGIQGFRSDFRPWIGIVFLGSVSVLLTRGVTASFSWGKNEIVVRKSLGRRQKRMHDLTPAEKDILRKYVAEETRTQTLMMGDGVVQGLVQAGVLYRSTTVGESRQGDPVFDHNVQPWAWDYLRKHPELLFAEGTPAE